MSEKKIAVTIGDPAGIGPEIIIRALNELDFKNILLIGNREIFLRKAQELDIVLNNELEIIDIPCNLNKINAGLQNEETGRLSFDALKIACDLANDYKISGIVTAPLSKKAINMAGYHYSGQTEILGEFLRQNTEQKLSPEMLFVSNDFRVMLLTRHIELASVSRFLTQASIIESTLALYNSLKNDFNIENPKIAICGLNPHCGEDGLLGQEENTSIIPALDKLRQGYGVHIEGPFPADTLWVKAAKAFFNKTSQPYDAYMACYHDQGLIPIKLLAMDYTVNTSINLPIIRTSPAHGTAFDIAGKNIANPQSMIEAIKLAALIAHNRTNLTVIESN